MAEESLLILLDYIRGMSVACMQREVRLSPPCVSACQCQLLMDKLNADVEGNCQGNPELITLRHEHATKLPHLNIFL